MARSSAALSALPTSPVAAAARVSRRGCDHVRARVDRSQRRNNHGSGQQFLLWPRIGFTVLSVPSPSAACREAASTRRLSCSRSCVPSAPSRLPSMFGSSSARFWAAGWSALRAPAALEMSAGPLGAAWPAPLRKQAAPYVYEAVGTFPLCFTAVRRVPRNGSGSRRSLSVQCSWLRSTRRKHQRRQLQPRRHARRDP